jgi:predicted dehydrogenase
LISHRFPFEQAEQAYALLVQGAPSLGILLEYPEAGPACPAAVRPVIEVSAPRPAAAPGAIGIGFIGAGNYARRTLIPAFAANRRARLAGICSPSGLPAAEAARQFGFAMAASDARRVIEHPGVAAVVIATPHGSHAALVEQALAAGKHVFVEKPLAVSYAQVARIERAAHQAPGQILVTGFNRRFAPLTLALRDRLGRLSGPRAFVMTVNAGRVDPGHWASEERIVGEACHFIDLLRFLAAAPVESVDASRLGTGGSAPESASIHLRFADGSIGTVHYYTEGHRGFAKERLEVFAGGAVLTLDNFRRLVCLGAKPLRAWPFARQDKGQAGLVDAFLQACAGQAPPPIPLEEQFEVARVTLEAAGEAH